MPKPWTSENFAIMTSRLLRIAEYPHKVNISDALAMLFTQEEINDATGQNVCRTLIGVLNSKEPPTCLVGEYRETVVRTCMDFSESIGGAVFSDTCTHLLLNDSF